MFQFTHPGKGATEAGLHRPTLCAGSFNSRTLGRVRHDKGVFNGIEAVFQFTHPGKGATVGQPYFHLRVDVSIHAPWEGCDAVVPAIPASGSEFQFTHPGKGATVGVAVSVVAQGVSIHAPWEGCDAIR